MSTSNGEIFAKFMSESYELGQPTPPEEPSGPRRPAPVPEAGTNHPAPEVREAAARLDFENTLIRVMNTY